MTRSPYEDLAVDLARAAGTRAAPDELPLFEATSVGYFETPPRARNRRPAHEPLGFGVGEVVPLVTTAALTVALDALKVAGTQLSERLATESTGWLGRLLGRLRRRKP